MGGCGTFGSTLFALAVHVLSTTGEDRFLMQTAHLQLQSSPRRFAPVLPGPTWSGTIHATAVDLSPIPIDVWAYNAEDGEDVSSV